MKKGLKIVGNILLWLFVVIAVFMTIIAFSSTKNQNGVAVIFGRMPITILSESMDPTLKKGDLIISHELSAEEKGTLKGEFESGVVVVVIRPTASAACWLRPR